MLVKRQFRRVFFGNDFNVCSVQTSTYGFPTGKWRKFFFSPSATLVFYMFIGLQCLVAFQKQPKLLSDKEKIVTEFKLPEQLLILTDRQ